LGDPDHFPHLDYVHLKPENIKDAKGRKPSDPDYDPKTLYVPENFLKQQTPGSIKKSEILLSTFTFKYRSSAMVEI
jgi:DNA mismatch repair protein MSH6